MSDIKSEDKSDVSSEEGHGYDSDLEFDQETEE